MTEIIYTPGVCNIGPEEIQRRKTVGWVGLIVTILLIAALFVFHAPYLLRITVFLPAFVAASGFIQAYFHFCVAFGQAGVFNVGPVGTTTVVADATAKADDKKRTVQLYLYIITVAILATAITLAL